MAWGGRLKRFAAIGALLALGATPVRQAGDVDDQRMIHAASEPQNWLVNGGDLSGSHFSRLTQITPANVGNLKPAWSFQYDTYRGQEAEPLVVDGVMYVSTSWSKVYALDAATGKQIWFFDPEVPGARGIDACCDTDNRGVAVYKGKVFVGTLDGRLIAIDAKTGKQAWSVQTTDTTKPLSITGYPRVIHDKVIIGNAGADFGVRGYVTAYDTATGRQAWRFYLVPGDPAAGPDQAASDPVMEALMRPTWAGDYYKYGGGGTAWNAINYDPELNQLYIGTGNGSPWNPRYRTAAKGDNLFLCSVVALNPDTGAYIWHYQVNPQEAWDYNATQPFVQADLTIDGKVRKVLMQAPKNGFFYVLDRTTGKLISAQNYVPVTWASRIDTATGRPVEAPNSRYTSGPFVLKPNSFGAHNWHAMAFDPRTGIVYLHALENGATVRDDPGFKPIFRGPFNTGLAQGPDPTPLSRPKLGAATLLAWDPVHQKEVWRVTQGRTGVLATAGGLVFIGEGETTGALSAYRSDNGRKVWSYKTPNGIQAGAISYAVNGVQYVAVTTGNGWIPFYGDKEAKARQNGRMIVFRLNGTAKLPPPPGPPPPASPSPDRFTAAQIAQGMEAYGVYCSRCHGSSATSLNVIPDLRRSGFLQTRDTWRAVVLEGALEHEGMIAWKDHLDADGVEAVRAYVNSEAIRLQAREHGKKVAPSKGPVAIAQ